MNTTDFPRHMEKDAEEYIKSKWWLGMTLGDILDRTADVFTSRIAVVDDKERLTFGQVRDNVDKLALSFLDLGLTKGDCIMLQLPNWHEYVYAYFAAQRIGCIPVLMISGYRQLEATHFAQLTEAKAWIVPEAYRKIDYLSFIDAVKQGNPQLKHVISVRAAGQNSAFTTSIEKLMERNVTEDDRRRLKEKRPDPRDVAHVMPSGGTTGLPKGIPRTHNDYISNVEFLHKGWDMSTSDVALVVVPVGHNLALLNVAGAMLFGYRLVLSDSTRPQDICRTIQKEKVTYMPTVPSLVRRIMELPDLNSYDLTSLKRLSAGGEPSTPDLILDVYRKLNCTYINEFGMSEGLLCRSSLTDDIDTICNSVGRTCCPYDKIRIMNERGDELAPGMDGELTTKGPGIFAGYMKNPVENEKSFTKDGYFRTGDQARIAPDGTLKITGRIKDLIIRGGENVTPGQVEDILSSHPGVAEVAVIGMPDKALGEKVCAYLRLAPGASPDVEGIKAFMAEKGASSLLIPERFEFVDSFPMTQAGKIDKKVLKKDIAQKLGVA